jgi:hypothetical protein
MSRWRRPATKTYDYNFKLGEHYYKPQLDYLDSRKGRGKTPPTAKSFAERFVDDPIYGRSGGVSSRRAGEGLGNLEKSRFGSLDDLNLGKNRSLFGEGGAGLDSPVTPSGSYTPRLIVGDRLLDSVGVRESKLSASLNASSLSSSRLQNEESQSSSLASRRKVGFVQSAEADLNMEDPFRSKFNTKMVAARKQADSLMEDMKQESDASASRFRARARARKEEQLSSSSSRREQQQSQSISSSNYGFEDDGETAAILSRVNEIGLRAKARLAHLEDTFPELQIGSSLATRRAQGSASNFYDAEDDDVGASRVASKSVKISKRTVKASYDYE